MKTEVEIIDEFTLMHKTKDADVAEIASMEAVLEAIGAHRWQKYLIFLCCAWGAFVGPMYAVSYQFLGATPDYWCQVPELISANWTQDQIKNLTLPKSAWKGDGVCEVLDLNFTMAAEVGYERSLEIFALRHADDLPFAAIPCSERAFDSSEALTVVSKWDLVCDRRPIYSTTQSAVYVGILIGSLTAGYICDMFGRRKVLVWLAPAYCLVGCLAALSTDVYMYIFLKCLIAAIGISLYIAGFVLAIEMCTTSQRALVGALFSIPWSFGYMLLPGIAYLVRDFVYLQIAITLPGLTLFPAYWYTPESPRWLILRGRFEEALSVLRGISDPKKMSLFSRDEIYAVMNRIFWENKKPSHNGARSFWTRILYKFFGLWVAKGWRWKLPIIFLNWFVAAMVYYGVSLNPPDLRTGKYMYIFLGGLLEVPGLTLLWPATRYLGRKKTMVALYLTCACAILGAMAIRYFNQEGDAGAATSEKYSSLLALSLVGKVTITAAFQLVWMYTLEVLPTEFRSVVVGEGSVFGRVGSMFSPYIVDLLKEIKKWAPDAIFGSISVVAGLLFLFLPETKEKNLPELTIEPEKDGKK